MDDVNLLSSSFQARIKKRNVLVALFSTLLISLSLIFNLLIVFKPHLLNAPLSSDIPIPIGIPIGIGLIFIFFGVSIIYLLLSRKALNDGNPESLQSEGVDNV